MYDFLNLDIDERACVLRENGVFLMNARSDAFSFSLYAVRDFYVEVVIKNSEDRITQIAPFKSGWRLDKYLNEIDISAALMLYHK